MTQKMLLEQMAKAGRLPHALLLEGESDTALYELAEYAAAAFLCEGNDPPCMACRSCRKVGEKIHPDLTVFDGSAGSSAFPVKLIREIIADAYIRPNDGAGKVYLLTHAENLSAAAQNTLLKLMEEPPAHLMMILCCDNGSKLLPTIRSRVTPLKTPETASYEKEKAAQIMELASGGSRYGLLKQMQCFEKDPEGFLAFLSEMRRYASDIACGGERCAFCTILQALKIVDIIDETAAAVKGNGYMPLMCTGLCDALGRVF